MMLLPFVIFVLVGGLALSLAPPIFTQIVNGMTQILGAMLCLALVVVIFFVVIKAST